MVDANALRWFKAAFRDPLADAPPAVLDTGRQVFPLATADSVAVSRCRDKLALEPTPLRSA